MAWYDAANYLPPRVPPRRAPRVRGALNVVQRCSGYIIFPPAAFLLLLLLPLLGQHAFAGQLAGRQLYEERCALCHGERGQGWDWAIKADKPPVPVPNLVKVVANRTDAYLVKIIKFGGSAVGLTSFMPAFGFNMEDQQVSDVVAYLRTLQRASGGIPSSYHFSVPERGGYRVIGKGLYEERCVLCHGEKGQGWDWAIKAAEPPVPVPDLVKIIPDRSDEYLFRIIRFGGRSVGLTPFMPAFGFNMRGQQVWDLVAYLRNLSGVGKMGLLSLGGGDVERRAPGRTGNLDRLAFPAKRHPWLRPAGYAQSGEFGKHRPGGNFAPGPAQPWPDASLSAGSAQPGTVGAGWRASTPWLMAHQGAPHRRTQSAGGKGPKGHRAGYFPHAVVVADFDNDGNPDLAIPAAGERKIFVLLGDGKAGVRSNHSYPVGKGPTWVDVADLNRDGKPDIVVTNAGAGTLTLYYGDGKGGMKNRRDINGIQGPSTVVILDVNQDGIPDLAVTQPAQSRVAILINDGKGHPRLQHTFQVNPGPHIMDKADLNGDGIDDLIVGSLGAHTLTVLLGVRPGVSAAPIVTKVGRFPHYRVYGDFNKDGRMDAAVVVAGDDAVQILIGDGTGKFKKTASIPAGVNPHGMAGGDFNRDGNTDLVVGSRSSKDARVLLGDGRGNFSAMPPFATGQDIITLATGDFDRDGITDLVMISASSDSVIFYTGDGSGNFHPVSAN